MPANVGNVAGQPDNRASMQAVYSHHRAQLEELERDIARIEKRKAETTNQEIIDMCDEDLKLFKLKRTKSSRLLGLEKRELREKNVGTQLERELAEVMKRLEQHRKDTARTQESIEMALADNNASAPSSAAEQEQSDPPSGPGN